MNQNVSGRTFFFVFCFISTFALGMFFFLVWHLYQILPLANIVPHEIGVGSEQVYSRRSGGLVSSVLDSRSNALPSSSSLVIVLYSKARHFTITKLISIKEYKLVQ